MTLTSALDAELDRYLDPSSLPREGRPRIVILMGGVGAGKSTVRREKFGSGYVVLDAALLFANIRHQETGPFPGDINSETRLWIVGMMLSGIAIRQRRHIVTEIVGADYGALKGLIEAMRRIDYEVRVELTECDPAEAMKRHARRSPSEVSAFDAEPYQLAWLLAEAETALPEPERRRRRMAVPDPSPAQEICLDAVSTLVPGADAMRGGQIEDVAERMAQHTREAFAELDRLGEQPYYAAVGAADLFYRRIADLELCDAFTRRYVSIAVRECFRQLLFRREQVYYIVDNEVPDYLFTVVVQLFGLAGVCVTSPALNGPDWRVSEVRLAGNLGCGLHAAYVERDASVNHLDAAQALADRFQCTATFRNLASRNSSFTLIGRR